MRRNEPSSLLLALVIACLAPCGVTLASSQLPIYIEADSATLDDQRGVSTYKGNVLIRQGETVITGDVVTVYSPDRVVQRMTSEGNPATLRTVDEKGTEVRAEAEHMEYRPPEQRAILSRHARVWQGEDEFRGDRISYRIDTSTLEVMGGTTGRVEGVFIPREGMSIVPGQTP